MTAARSAAYALAALLALPAAARGQGLAIERVTVIDVRRGVHLPNHTVLVSGGRIALVGPAGSVRVPPGATRVAGNGGFLIPGLWDMHTHLTIVKRPGDDARSRPPFAQLAAALLGHGVTGVRDMSGDLPRLRGWRDSIAAGLLEGPRLVITGGKLGEGAVVRGAPARLASRADVDAAVAALRRGGADFVKAGALPPDLLEPAARSAAAAGLPFAGHVPTGVSAVTGARLGMRSIEHLTGMLLASSSDEAALAQRELLLLGRERTSVPRRVWRRMTALFGLYRPLSASEVRRLQLNTFDTVRADAMARVLLEEGTFVTPTLLVLETLSRDTSYGRRESYPVFLRLVRRLHARGVPMLAGTDVGQRPFGRSLHDELALFVREAGFSPLEALRTATLAPAAYFRADSLGAVEPGMVADLVLLDADPTADITNLRRIRAVVARGRIYQGRDLRALRARAEPAPR